MAPIKKTPVKKTSIKKKTSAPALGKFKKPISKTKVAVGLAGLAALGTAAFLGNKYLKSQVQGTASNPLQMESMNTEEDSIILKQIENLMKITNINDLNNECANLKNKNSKFHDKIVNICQRLLEGLENKEKSEKENKEKLEKIIKHIDNIILIFYKDNQKVNDILSINVVNLSKFDEENIKRQCIDIKQLVERRQQEIKDLLAIYDKTNMRYRIDELYEISNKFKSIIKEINEKCNEKSKFLENKQKTRGAPPLSPAEQQKIDVLNAAKPEKTKKKFFGLF